MGVATDWYDEGATADAGEEWSAICRVMRDLAEAVDPYARDRWEAFARYVRETALDQEVYGEAIAAQPELLDPMWSAFSYAWGMAP